MTQIIYDKLLHFAKCMIQRQLSYLQYNLLTEYDFVAEAYAVGFDNFKAAKKIICDLVYKEKYKFIGSIQRKVIKEKCTSKTCKCCKKDKPISEFRKVIDKRYGFEYYRYKCNECTSIYYKSAEYKARRKINYQNNPLTREKATQRSVEWNRANKPWLKHPS